MQADIGKFGNKSNRGIVGAAKFIWKDGGVRGFWRGNLANILKVGLLTRSTVPPVRDSAKS